MIKPSDGTGSWSAVRSRFVGITPLTLAPREPQRSLQKELLKHKPFHRQPFLFNQQERGKKISEEARARPQVSWPVALRMVRAWLEPWIMLRRYWRAWSEQPPPAFLQGLLEALEHGQRLFLYGTF